MNAAVLSAGADTINGTMGVRTGRVQWETEAVLGPDGTPGHFRVSQEGQIGVLLVGGCRITLTDASSCIDHGSNPVMGLV